jgi:hypothetical protein
MGDETEIKVDQPEGVAPPLHPDNGGAGPVMEPPGSVDGAVVGEQGPFVSPPSTIQARLFALVDRFVLLEEGATPLTPETSEAELLEIVEDVMQRYAQIAEDHRDAAVGMAQAKEVLDGHFPTPCEKGIHPEVVRLLNTLLKPCPLCSKTPTPGVVHGTRCPTCRGHKRVWILE